MTVIPLTHRERDGFDEFFAIHEGIEVVFRKLKNQDIECYMLYSMVNGVLKIKGIVDTHIDKDGMQNGWEHQAITQAIVDYVNWLNKLNTIRYERVI